MSTAVIGPSAIPIPPPIVTPARSSRRKQRCWIFHVADITRIVTEADLLSSVRERYTTVKRLVVRPSSSNSQDIGNPNNLAKSVLVEVQFTGPQPSEGPGALLCDLLCGSSVDAQPVELPRGRKKRARVDATGSEASDSDVEDGGSRKMGGHRSANSLQQAAIAQLEEDEGLSKSSHPSLMKKSSSGMFGTLTPRRHSTYEKPPTPSARLEPLLSSVGLFKSPPNGHGEPCTVVVPSEGSRMLPNSSPPQQIRTVSQDGLHQQHMPSPQQLPTKPDVGRGPQWEEVVRHANTPQGSSTNSLDIGSIDLSSNGQAHLPVKSEFQSLITTSNNSNGTWSSNDSHVGLLGPMPPPQAVHPPLRGWSFDSNQPTCSGISDGDLGSGGNNVMDLSDVDNLFRSSESDGSFGIPRGNADAGAGCRLQQLGCMPVTAKWAPEGVLPMEKILIEPSRKECDFEGRPPLETEIGVSHTSKTSRSSSPPGQCQLLFTGLDRTGHDLRSLRVTAHFGVDSEHKVGKVTSPIQVGANGRTHAALFYPSMQEIWPELYSTANIRVVEVDVVVEIRSESGEYQYVGPQLKVSYLRGPSANTEDSTPRVSGRRTASRAPVSSIDDSPNVTYSCVDYSCGDWFADMYQSVFKGGAVGHQSLHDDPHELMAVDS